MTTMAADPAVAHPMILYEDVTRTCHLSPLKEMTEGGKSYREMIEKKKLMYVHEVQHWLRKRDNGEDGLKVNEWKS